MPRISLADIDFGISNKSIQVLGKSRANGSQGHLTSYLSPNTNLAIISDLKNKLKLVFTGEVTRANFKAPVNHTLANGSILFTQYSTGILYLVDSNVSLKFLIGLEDSLYYSNSKPLSILLDKSNDFFLKSSFKYLTTNSLLSDFLTSFQLSLQALTPLKNEFDKGSLSYGGEILLEKEFKRDEYFYAAQTFLGYQQNLMKNMTFTKEDIGIRFLLKIPIKSKKLL